MGRLEFKTVWIYSLQGAIALVLEVLVGIILNLPKYCTPYPTPCWIVVLLGGIFAYFVLLSIVHLAWSMSRKTISGFWNVIRKWWITPRIKINFASPNVNDLRLYIHNPKHSKPVFVDVNNEKILTLDRTNTLHWTQGSLHNTKKSYVGRFPILADTLQSNDTREIQIGWPFQEKLSLKYIDNDSPVYGFPDGIYEYFVSCNGKNSKGNKFSLPTVSIWLTIKDGSLIEIRKEL